MAYDFHYQPTGSGAISGQQVLEQTEDAINELGDYVNDNVGGAMDVAQQALETAQNAKQDAQTALNTANNAEGVAIQAQNDVSNLSGTVTNIGNRVTTAEGNIGNLQGRMTTAEGNITNLQGRMTTAEGNIGNLQTAVSTAQATANSAQQTATTARQQSYVFRYSSTALTASSTNSNTLLDNTDNLKVGDKVIDSNGVLFSITAIDTANSTFTIGTALIDLAQDSDVVHKSGNETVGGIKTFLDVPISFKSSTAELGVTGGNTKVIFTDKNLLNLAGITFGNYESSKLSYCRFHIYDKDSDNQEVENSIEFSYVNNNQNAYFRPNKSNFVNLGTVSNRWAKVYANNYYYGANNVEFSAKFVTTDTAQTISGNKTFSSNVNVYNSDSTTDTANIVLKNSKAERGSTTNIGEQTIFFLDKDNAQIGNIKCEVDSNGYSNLTLQCSDTNDTSSGVQVRKTATGVTFQPTSNNQCYLGQYTRRWYSTYTSRINNLEPSSLSLPSDRSARIDISSYFTNTGTGDTNTYTVPANGYIFMDVADCVSLYMYSQTTGNLSNYGNSVCRNTVGKVTGFLPVRKDDVFVSQWYTTATNVTLTTAYFIPCQGNV